MALYMKQQILLGVFWPLSLGGDLLLQFQELFLEDRWYQVSTCYSIPRSTPGRPAWCKEPEEKTAFRKVFFCFFWFGSGEKTWKNSQGNWGFQAHNLYFRWVFPNNQGLEGDDPQLRVENAKQMPKDTYTLHLAILLVTFLGWWFVTLSMPQ